MEPRKRAPQSDLSSVESVRQRQHLPARRFYVVAGGGVASDAPFAEKPRVVQSPAEPSPTFELLGAIQNQDLAAFRQLLGTTGADLHMALEMISHMHDRCCKESQRAGSKPGSFSEQLAFYESAKSLIESHIADKL